MSNSNAIYWLDVQQGPVTSYPALAGTLDCDVCVVGGGIAGCSTALHLAQRGYRVTLLEQQHIGFGASGRSGAQALFGLAVAQQKLEALIGAGAARQAFNITVEGLALLKSLIATHDIDCDWTSGQLHVAMKPRQDRELQDWALQLQHRLQYPSVSMLSRDALRDYIASDRYTSALLDTNSGHLDPLRYTRGLARAAVMAGAHVFEHSRARRYETRVGTPGAASSIRVETQNGQVTCRQLVLCGNALLGAFAPALATKIMAVGTYMLATEPLGAEQARALLPQNSAVADLNWVLDYFRRSADHRLLFGGRVSYSGLDREYSSRATRKRMLAVFPQLAERRIDYCWGGNIDITLNRAPHFGRLEPDVFFMQGFCGHGIVLAGMAGKLIAEAIAGTNERFDVFARIPHRNFPGGDYLRRPALVLGMLWYRLRDWL